MNKSDKEIWQEALKGKNNFETRPGPPLKNKINALKKQPKKKVEPKKDIEKRIADLEKEVKRLHYMFITLKGKSNNSSEYPVRERRNVNEDTIE